MNPEKRSKNQKNNFLSKYPGVKSQYLIPKQVQIKNRLEDSTPYKSARKNIFL